MFNDVVLTSKRNNSFFTKLIVSCRRITTEDWSVRWHETISLVKNIVFLYLCEKVDRKIASIYLKNIKGITVKHLFQISDNFKIK